MPYFEGLEKAKLVIDVFARDKPRFGPYTVFMGDVMRATQSLNDVAREAIALRVSTINQCHYCIGSHRAALLELGCSPGQVDDFCTGHTDDSRLAGLLLFSEKLTIHPKGVDGSDLAKLRELGASDQDIEDTIAVTAVFALMNRLVDGYGIKGDDQAFRMVGKSVSKGGYDSVPIMLGIKSDS